MYGACTTMLRVRGAVVVAVGGRMSDMTLLDEVDGVFKEFPCAGSHGPEQQHHDGNSSETLHEGPTIGPGPKAVKWRGRSRRFLLIGFGQHGAEQVHGLLRFDPELPDHGDGASEPVAEKLPSGPGGPGVAGTLDH